MYCRYFAYGTAWGDSESNPGIITTDVETADANTWASLEIRRTGSEMITITVDGIKVGDKLYPDNIAAIGFSPKSNTLQVRSLTAQMLYWTGNSDRNTPSIGEFATPQLARYVRVLPVGNSRGTSAMRVGLLCNNAVMTDTSGLGNHGTVHAAEATVASSLTTTAVSFKSYAGNAPADAGCSTLTRADDGAACCVITDSATCEAAAASTDLQSLGFHAAVQETTSTTDPAGCFAYSTTTSRFNTQSNSVALCSTNDYENRGGCACQCGSVCDADRSYSYRGTQVPIVKGARGAGTYLAQTSVTASDSSQGHYVSVPSLNVSEFTISMWLKCEQVFDDGTDAAYLLGFEAVNGEFVNVGARQCDGSSPYDVIVVMSGAISDCEAECNVGVRDCQSNCGAGTRVPMYTCDAYSYNTLTNMCTVYAYCSAPAALTGTLDLHTRTSPVEEGLWGKLVPEYGSDTGCKWSATGSMSPAVTSTRTADHVLSDEWHFVSISRSLAGTVEYFDGTSNTGGPFTFRSGASELLSSQLAKINLLSHAASGRHVTRTRAFLDEVRIYNRSLAAHEVRRLYCQGLHSAWVADSTDLAVGSWKHHYNLAAGGTVGSATSLVDAKTACSARDGCVGVTCTSSDAGCTMRTDLQLSTSAGAHTYIMPYFSDDGTVCSCHATGTCGEVPPELVDLSPSNKQIAVQSDSLITLTFSKEIRRGAGLITFTPSSGASPVTISVADTSQVNVTGNKVLIFPTGGLPMASPFNEYTVSYPAGFVKDVNDLGSESCCAVPYVANHMQSSSDTGMYYFGQVDVPDDFRLSFELTLHNDPYAEDVHIFTIGDAARRGPSVYKSAGASGPTDGPIKYIGCFQDDSNRDLAAGPKAYGYDASTCRDACTSYTYFALQSSSLCSCDNTFSTPSATYGKLDDSLCNSGSGGSYTNAIYTTEVMPHTTLDVRIDTSAASNQGVDRLGAAMDLNTKYLWEIEMSGNTLTVSKNGAVVSQQAWAKASTASRTSPCMSEARARARSP